jgi:stage III sporulation protein SpoIIIAA
MNPTNGNIKNQKQKEPHLIKPLCVVIRVFHQKLENIELLKHLNQHSTTVLIGKPRSGKHH